jgi:16S rRNA (adenine1518-N6/adenine1519-N6)-dimethyltransferase
MVRARKRFGQHFLEAAWVRKVAGVVDAEPDDVILEIGPGRGALTRVLAASGARIVAVEIDRDLAGELEAAAPPNVQIVRGNVLDVDWADITGRTRMRIVGNLPYNISSPILMKLVDLHRRTGLVSDAVVMLQREVADRVSAKPGTKDYGVLSVVVQLHATVDQVLALPPGAFRPTPKVMSSVIRLRFGPPRADVADIDLLERLVKGMFTQRRKTLSNALKTFAETAGASATDALARAGIDPQRRPETLALDEVARLANVFVQAGRG